ncbi:hypothetical protein HDZ31DRAFT_84506 [Schizophyllum fasciatum]
MGSSSRPATDIASAPSGSDVLSVPFEGDSSCAAESPPRKRQRTMEEGGETRAVSTEDENTSSLHEMPLDVLFEILNYLDPISLLHLSRTSHALRNTLMSRSSIRVWKNSYATTDHGLPPVPEDMTIPEFLTFIVDKNCDYCRQDQPTYDNFIRIWTIGLRCCRRCLHDSPHIMCEEKLREIKIIRDVHRWFGKDYKLSSLFPSFRCNSYTFHPSYRAYPRVGIEDLAAQFEQANKRKLVAAKKAWLTESAAEFKKVLEHAGICEAWEEQQRQKRRAEVDRIKAERLAEIYDRLKALDRYDELKKTYYSEREFKELAFVSKVQPLTEEEWEQNRDQIVQFVDELKVKRLANERRRTLEDRYRLLSQVYTAFLDGKSRRDRGFFPSVCDICSYEEVTTFIEAMPVEQELPKEDIHTLIDKLAQSKFPAWRAAREDELVGMLNARDKERERPATKADFNLATSVFIRYYSSPVWYPEVLSERHDPRSVVYNVQAWSAEAVTAPVDHLHIAKQLIQLAGLDPETATPADMDARDIWFARAKDLRKRKEGLFVMNWRGALANRERNKDCKLAVISDADKALARTRYKQYGELPGLTKKGTLRKRGAPRGFFN